MNTPKNNHLSLSYPIVDLKRHLPADLAAVNEYYRILIEILRSKLPARIALEEHERSRLALAALNIKNCMGQAFRSIDLLFKPDTLLAWYRKLKAQHATYNNTAKKPGRPSIPLETVAIVLKIAQENPWGYKRIADEMKKLGHDICPNTVKSILLDNGIPPNRLRKGMSWKTFIMAHHDVTWACDFFTEEVLTTAGLMTCYVLFFIHLGSRRVHVAGCTYNPDAPWVSQQARNFSMSLGDNPRHPCKYLIHDNDSSLLALDVVLKGDAIKIKKTAVRSPWQNGYAERFVRTMREILDNMILFGRHHLDYVVKKAVHHYNTQRPHQGLDGRVPLGYEYPQEAASLAEIESVEELGGLLRYYRVRKAD